MGVLSMTGFGRAVRETPQGRFVAEIRSLNNRFLDINLRLPSGLAGLDPALRERIRGAVSRGKIDCLVRWEPSESAAPAARLVPSVLERLIVQAEDLHRRRPDLRALSLGDFLRVPGVVHEPSQEDLDSETMEAVVADLLATVEDALDGLKEARKREGESTIQALRTHHEVLSRALEAVDAAKGQVVDRYRERLTQRIAELLRGSDVPVDPGRLELEVALFADKADIREEIDRLRGHLDTFLHTLEKEDQESVGRPLDFLVQEMLRESNTIGSKARDLEIANQVLAMKNAIESIKEQVQNVE